MDYHPRVAGCDAMTSQPCMTPMGCTAHINSVGQGRGMEGVATLEVATRNGAMLYPDSPIWGVQMQGGRGIEILVMWGSTAPGPVSYLRYGHTCMRRPHSRCEAPFQRGWGYHTMYKLLPRRVRIQAEGLGQALAHAGLPSATLLVSTWEGGLCDGPPGHSEHQLTTTQISGGKQGLHSVPYLTSVGPGGCPPGTPVQPTWPCPGRSW